MRSRRTFDSSFSSSRQRKGLSQLRTSPSSKLTSSSRQFHLERLFRLARRLLFPATIPTGSSSSLIPRGLLSREVCHQEVVHPLEVLVPECRKAFLPVELAEERRCQLPLFLSLLLHKQSRCLRLSRKKLSKSRTSQKHLISRTFSAGFVACLSEPQRTPWHCQITLMKILKCPPTLPYRTMMLSISIRQLTQQVVRCLSQTNSPPNPIA